MTPLRSNRIVGVAVMGGDCGTNRDPALLEADRLASWAALTKGRVPERMTSMATTVPSRDLSWAKTNEYYVRPRTARGGQ